MSVQAAYRELVSVILWIDDHTHVVDFPPNDLGRRFAGGCLDMAIEHQAAIAALAEKELWGSAHSLGRPAFESYVRGAWFWRCASAKELKRFHTCDKIKDIGVLISEVEQSLGNQMSALSNAKSRHWKGLCSFTHTGMLQVTRRYSKGMLKPSYSPSDCIRLLNFAAATGLLAAAELFAISSNQEAERAVLDRMKEFVKLRPTP
jgi:hypothetical protein